MMDAPSRDTAASDRAKLQVMIVEDHAGVRASMEAMVEMWRQVEITSVEDFHAAAHWIETIDRLDLLLCDVCLPGGNDGLDVAKMASSSHPSVAVVMFSADVESEIRGMSDRYSFLRKPFGRDALFRQIDDALLRASKPVLVEPSA
jgi:DNA-binding NtrC family response regulator